MVYGKHLENARKCVCIAISAENGYYYETAADGESYNLFSIVSKAEDIGDNKLKLYYNNYTLDIEMYLDPDVSVSDYYSLSAEDASKKTELEKGDQHYAIVRIDGSSYILEHLE